MSDAANIPETVRPRRVPGDGWLVLVGGGEITFEETLDADAAWMEKVPEGPIGFVPAASGSVDYGEHFSTYMEEVFGREAHTVPIYRARDGRRTKNAERLEECAAVYLGGGVTDHLLDALADTPAAAALLALLGRGGVVVAMAAAAQALGTAARSIRIGETVPGLGWLPGGAVEPNFDPGHDRRLRRLLGAPGVSWGLGIAAGAAVLLGPDGAVEGVGPSWGLASPEGEAVDLGLDDAWVYEDELADADLDEADDTADPDADLEDADLEDADHGDADDGGDAG